MSSPSVGLGGSTNAKTVLINIVYNAILYYHANYQHVLKNSQYPNLQYVLVMGREEKKSNLKRDKLFTTLKCQTQTVVKFHDSKFSNVVK